MSLLNLVVVVAAPHNKGYRIVNCVANRGRVLFRGPARAALDTHLCVCSRICAFKSTVLKNACFTLVDQTPSTWTTRRQSPSGCRGWCECERQATPPAQSCRKSASPTVSARARGWRAWPMTAKTNLLKISVLVGLPHVDSCDSSILICCDSNCQTQPIW